VPDSPQTPEQGREDVLERIAVELDGIKALRAGHRKEWPPGCEVHDSDLHKWAVGIRAERDRPAVELAEARAELGVATDLLKRVVIQGVGQPWTGREMHDWACDYKDFSNGHGRAFYAKPHDNCGHRSRETSNDEPVPCYDPRCIALRSQMAALQEENARLRGLLAEMLALNPSVTGDMEKVGVWAATLAAARAALSPSGEEEG